MVGGAPGTLRVGLSAALAVAPRRCYHGAMITTRTGRHRKRWLIAAGAMAAETVPLWRRGYGLGGTVVVRCRDGHVFSTMWLPGVSLKSLRLGPWRVQRCPVGHHWSVVTPVNRSMLGGGELAQALATRDVRVP